MKTYPLTNASHFLVTEIPYDEIKQTEKEPISIASGKLLKLTIKRRYGAEKPRDFRGYSTKIK